jgi:bifunctional non-homologous end joining protein LigD
MPIAGAKPARKSQLLWTEPIRPIRRADAFHHPDWIFELKYDGFRALAYIEPGNARLVSRNRNRMSRFQDLAQALAAELQVQDAILDGEIVCVDEDGRPLFNELFHKKGQPLYYAFDLLWLNGEDLRRLPLLERKSRLEKIIPKHAGHIGGVTHWAEHGQALFQEVKNRDLEGIVAKRADAPYAVQTTWYKIKNPQYTQAVGRNELFERA